ncbi:MAG TPA: hypothetical protein ENH82_20410, partial [bacterium]|nr:hypothetical protein [bacterium]
MNPDVNKEVDLMETTTKKSQKVYYWVLLLCGLLIIVIGFFADVSVFASIAGLFGREINKDKLEQLEHIQTTFIYEGFLILLIAFIVKYSHLIVNILRKVNKLLPSTLENKFSYEVSLISII